MTLCNWNPFAVSIRGNVPMMLLISREALCLFSVGYFVNKRIVWPGTVWPECLSTTFTPMSASYARVTSFLDINLQ